MGMEPPEIMALIAAREPNTKAGRDARAWLDEYDRQTITPEVKAMHEAWGTAPRPVGWPVFVFIWQAARDFYHERGERG